MRPETRANTASSAKELLRRFYFDTLTHDPQALRYLIDLVGAERIVVGTDAPFDMGDENPRATLSALSPEEVVTLRRNALRLLERSMKRWTALVPVLIATSRHSRQGYPRKPILMLVPLQAASAVDNAARIVAQRMSENMGQQIVVENQPGAAGLIGTERVAKAAPDGYTIGGFNDSIMTMLPNLHAKLPWDILKDFEPVSLVATIEWGLVAQHDSPYQERGRRDRRGEGEARASSTTPRAATAARSTSRWRCSSRAPASSLTHIPYKGATAAAVDVARPGRRAVLPGPADGRGLIRGGKLRLLGVASRAACRSFPTRRRSPSPASRLRVQLVVRDHRARRHAEGNRRAAERRRS